jgi:tetratricopeptide (TPR) repeat protein
VAVAEPANELSQTEAFQLESELSEPDPDLGRSWDRAVGETSEEPASDIRDTGYSPVSDEQETPVFRVAETASPSEVEPQPGQEFGAHDDESTSPAFAEVSESDLNAKADETREGDEEAGESDELDSVLQASERPWSVPEAHEPASFEPARSKLADMAEIVLREPLNNGARFALAQELEGAGEVEQAVIQYGVILTSRDPRLIEDVRTRLEWLLAGGAKIHGLQRLLGDAYMQLGLFERAIEAYSMAFDELRSRQITDKGRKL